jgi:hypothetical protein
MTVTTGSDRPSDADPSVEEAHRRLSISGDELPDHVIATTRFAGLLGIRRQGINLALWPRSLPARLSEWLDALPSDAIPDVRFDCRGPQIGDAIWEETRPFADDSAGWKLLLMDLCTLGTSYAQHVDAGRLGVRIERVDTDLCTKFHCDATGLRLLTTYRGPGTCWVPNHAVRRHRLGPHGENADIVPDLTAIRRFPRYTVGLLKGEAHARGAADPAIVHRSPTLRGTGEVRLLLCIGPLVPGHVR